MNRLLYYALKGGVPICIVTDDKDYVYERIRQILNKLGIKRKVAKGYKKASIIIVHENEITPSQANRYVVIHARRRT